MLLTPECATLTRCPPLPALTPPKSAGKSAPRMPPEGAVPSFQHHTLMNLLTVFKEAFSRSAAGWDLHVLQELVSCFPSFPSLAVTAAPALGSC